MAYLIPKEKIEEWEYNKTLRGINDTGQKRLDANLELGQHTTLLVYKTPENKIICLGGNNRLKRMKEMEYKDIECTVLEFGKDDLGFYPIFNGRVYKRADGTIPIHFPSIEEGMVQIALSHNVAPAYDKQDGVREIIQKYPAVEWWKYEVQLAERVDLDYIKKHFEMPKDAKPKPAQKPMIVIKFESMEELEANLPELEEFIEDHMPSAWIVKQKKG